MNKTIGLQLIVYSLVLAGLGYLTHHLAPALARPSLISGLAGGALCFVWGLRIVAGRRGKALPLLTLIPVNFVLLSQTVMTWIGESHEVPGQRTAVIVIASLFALSFAMLMRIAYAGVTFDRQAKPTPEGGAKSRTGERPAAPAQAGKARRL